MTRDEQIKVYQKIIAKAWADEDFKQRLLSNPSGTLKEEGVEVPSGVEVCVVENTPTRQYLVLPPKPDQDADLEHMEERIAAEPFF
ncbi:MAG: NHLP leader peptide family RiPP precursor [Deltaproteobacteria bacterium]|nr:NHLP leader peptide family RiPP precursor [Deltaproteobacteria bacterium]MBF0527210.1 NHLP leader peptide family RiPP precursor [Deltaproteobacteria bacterium]